MISELIPKFDSRKSFYNKARVKTEDGRTTLISYYTEVAYIENGEAVVKGTYSNTTIRHIKEFLKQNGFKADSTDQLVADFMRCS